MDLHEAVDLTASEMGVRRHVRLASAPQQPLSLRILAGGWVARVGKRERRIDDLTAAVLLLAHRLPVIEATCSTCHGSTHALDEGVFINPVLARRARMYHLRFMEIWSGRQDCRVLFGGCPDCRAPDPVPDGRPVALHQPATGKVTRSWAELLLDAVGETCPCCEGSGDFADDPEPGCLNCASTGRVCVDQGARQHVEVLADRLQAEGDPLGEWLALWLADVPCPACADMTEDGEQLRGTGGCGWCSGRPPIAGAHGVYGHPDCQLCEGSGRCGHCHGAGLDLGSRTDAIIAALRGNALNTQRVAQS